MSTHMFFRSFASFCIGQISHQQRKRSMRTEDGMRDERDEESKPLYDW